MSEYDGEYPLTIKGDEYTVVFDYAALAALQSNYDADVIENLSVKIDPMIFAGVLAIGLKRHHPKMTEKKVIELSPPLVPASNAVSQALNYAYFGADEPSEGSGETTEKKT